MAPDPRCKGERCTKVFLRLSDVELHHPRKHHGRPELLFDVNNIVALCHACHSALTKRGL